MAMSCWFLAIASDELAGFSHDNIFFHLTPIYIRYVRSTYIKQSDLINISVLRLKFFFELKTTVNVFIAFYVIASVLIVLKHSILRHDFLFSFCIGQDSVLTSFQSTFLTINVIHFSAESY